MASTSVSETKRRRSRAGSINHCVYKNPVTGRTDRLQSLGGSNRYYVVSELARGAFSTAYLCFDRIGKSEVCVKAQRVNVKGIAHMPYHEAAVMEYCKTRMAGSDHVGAKHVLEILDTYEDKEMGTHYIVSPYAMRGDAFSFIQDLTKCTASYLHIVRGFIRDIIVAVHFLHSIGVLHLDIKLENFLVYWDPELNREILKVCDFGFSKMGNISDKEVKLRGSLLYCPPEVMIPESFDGIYIIGGADVWAAMTCAFCLIHDFFPFVSYSMNLDNEQATEFRKEVGKRMVENLTTGPPNNGEGLPIFKEDRLKWMEFFINVFTHPDVRPTMDEIVAMEWPKELIIEDEERSAYRKNSGMLDFCYAVDFVDESLVSKSMKIPIPEKSPRTSALEQGSMSSRPVKGSPTTKRAQKNHQDTNENLAKDAESKKRTEARKVGVRLRLLRFSAKTESKKKAVKQELVKSH